MMLCGWCSVDGVVLMGMWRRQEEEEAEEEAAGCSKKTKTPHGNVGNK